MAPMRQLNKPFWQTKTLSELNPQEWESLCDNCGRCCMHKFQDEDTEQVYFTNVVCRYLHMKTCRCRHYENRQTLVPGCLTVSAGRPEQFAYLPESCAYRQLAEGKDLEWWHPLVSGTAETVHEAGISVRGKVVSDEFIHPKQLEEHVIDWVKGSRKN